MKVLLTGATGLLGGHILDELIERKINVKCIYRNSVPDYLKKNSLVEFVQADITKKDTLTHAIEGCNAIIHAAADTSMLPTFSEKRNKINVEGTDNLVKLAIANDIDRFIFVGSVNVFKYGSTEVPGTENIRTTNTKGMPEYNITKIKAHSLIEKAVKEKNLKGIIVTPCYMLGENDYKPSSGKMVQTILDRKLPFSSPGGKNVVYVKDVAFAICNALNKGKIGETYILGNTNISYRELFNLIAKNGNVPAPKFNVPCFAIKFFGFLGSAKESVFKRTPLFNLPMAQASCQKNYYDPSKAIEELNLPQTPIETTIKNTVNWFLEQKEGL